MARREYLAGSRTAVLNLDGFAALQARLSHHATRLPVRLDLVKRHAAAYYREFDLWESWAERTGEEEGFQSWLDLPSPIRPGSSRRETLGADYEEIRDEMITEIGDVAR